MDDLISRQAAIEALYKMLHDCFWADDKELGAVITTLNDLPSAHSEIIRCKDCKYADEDGVCQHSMGLAIQDDDDFCSYAERRTDD